MLSLDRTSFYLAYIAFSIVTCQDLTSLLLCVPVYVLCLSQVRAIATEEVSSEDVFWFCIFLYFGVVPTQALNDGHFSILGPTSGINYPFMEIAEAMAVVLVFLVGFLIGKRMVANRNHIQGIALQDGSLSQTSMMVLGMLMLAGFGLYVTLAGGPANISLPRTEKDVESINVLAYPFLALGCSALYMIGYEFFQMRARNLVNLTILAFGIVSLAFCINIYNSPRFFLVGCWVPLVMVCIRRISYRFLYTSSVLIIFVVMPLLSLTTRYGSTQAIQATEVGEVSPFLIRDVDIFETATHSIQFSEKHGLMWGDNLLAIVAFYIPRSFWPEKPIVGGLWIGGELYGIGTATTPNLSYFPAFDGYLDFGVFGAGLVGCMFGIIFWSIQNYSNRYYRARIIGFALCATLPILLRGPLGAVIGFPLCLLVCTWALLKVFEQSTKDSALDNR